MNNIKFTTAAEAVKCIKSGDHIHLSSVASAPQCLIKAMCDRGRNGEFKDVHIHHLHTEGPAPYSEPEFEGVFQLDSLAGWLTCGRWLPCRWVCCLCRLHIPRQQR